MSRTTRLLSMLRYSLFLTCLTPLLHHAGHSTNCNINSNAIQLRGPNEKTCSQWAVSHFYVDAALRDVDKSLSHAVGHKKLRIQHASPHYGSFHPSSQILEQELQPLTQGRMKQQAPRRYNGIGVQACTDYWPSRPIQGAL
ncbi:hypothetical protein F4824DRAFT_374186 [Ustulina deusta]|nr:hypothetical protein F4824DRAFT_374186 [Ustulina deusta]